MPYFFIFNVATLLSLVALFGNDHASTDYTKANSYHELSNISTDSTAKYSVGEIVQKIKESILSGDVRHRKMISTQYYKSWNEYKGGDIDSLTELDVKYTRILCSSDEAQSLDVAFNNKSDSLGRIMIGLWKKWDKIASTLVNERLFEHYQRIMYVQDNFRKAKTTVFGTDDRGYFYVKYGKPTRKRNVITSVSDVTDPRTGNVYTFDLGSVVVVDIELWEYQFEGRKDRLKLFFGENKSNSKPFAYYPNITDLIPWNNARININGGFIPQYKLKNMIYVATLEQLGRLDGVFSAMYQRFEADIMAMGSGQGLIEAASLTMPQFTHQLESVALKDLSESPSQESQNFKNVPTLKLTKSIFRLPGSTGTDYVVYHEIDFSTHLRREIQRFQLENSSESMFQLRANELIYHNQEVIVERKQNHGIHRDKIYHIIKNRIENIHVEAKLFSSFELHNLARINLLPVERVNSTDSVKATLMAFSNQAEVPLPSLLNREGFGVGDVILAAEYDSSSFRIPVLPKFDHVFHQSGKIIIYYEVFSPVVERYRLQYRLNQDRGFLSRFIVKKGIQLLFPEFSSASSEYFEIELDSYPPGEYRLDLIFEQGSVSIERILYLIIVP